MAVRSSRWYVSLDALKNELGISNTTHDAKLKRYIQRATDWWEKETGRHFIPVTATKSFDVPDNVPRGALLVDDLLAVTSITDDQGALASTEYFLYPANSKPKRRVEINLSVRGWYYSSTRQQVIDIAGTWGYCDDYEDTGAALAAAITSTTATTFTVPDGNLIEVGWCLLVDTEQMFVTKVVEETITVQRGNGGTTAATHLINAPIYRYVPPANVEEAVVMLASTWHAWRQSGGVKEQRIGDYTVKYEDGWPIPVTVSDMAKRYKPLV